jgi:ABC-type sulfate transport system permease component
MRRYQSIPDACFGVVLLLAALQALLMGYGNFELVNLVGSFFNVPSLGVPFTILLLSSGIAWWQLLHSRIKWWAYSGILVAMLWVMFFSGNWFTSGFHDLAMHYFDSHGRFGCSDGQTYIFVTLPRPGFCMARS